jgi:Cation/multidrug efflux pump
VQVNGGEVREIQVNLDPGRLGALGLPGQAVADKLAYENLDLPAGKVVREGQNIALRTKGEFRATAEIENVILRSAGGSTPRVKDVGTVIDGYKERESTTRLNGSDAVSFAVRKQSGRTRSRFHGRCSRCSTRWHPRSRTSRSARSTTTRTSSSRTWTRCASTSSSAASWPCFVIFVFMRDWRSTLISALALPTSVIATFFFMYVAGFTINMMTLMALSLSSAS